MSETKKIEYFAKVPHNIVDVAVPDMMKLLLWYCYDKSPEWTFSVGEVAGSLGKTNSCIRRYVRTFTATGVLKQVGENKNKYGWYPIYKFDRTKVQSMLLGHLKMNPETNPETDVETKGGMGGETSGGIQESHTDINSTEIDTTNINRSEINSIEIKPTKGFSDNAVPNSNPPSSQDAEGGLVGVASNLVPALPLVSNGIKPAVGISDVGGNKDTGTTTGTSSAPATIQTSAGGDTNETVIQTGGSKGGRRLALVNDNCEWLMNRWLKDEKTPYTKTSIELIKQEILKELAAINWENYPDYIDPRQEVGILKTELTRKLGVFKT